MNIEKIEQNLQRIFHQEGHRLVFWYEPEQTFVESLPELELDSVQVLDLKDWPSLELKLKLEREDTEGKYLLYAPFAESGAFWTSSIYTRRGKRALPL